MLFATTSASDLLAGIGAVSSPVVESLLPYLYVIGGLFISFWVVKKLISLIPKR
jgi:hypothetical protein